MGVEFTIKQGLRLLKIKISKSITTAIIAISILLTFEQASLAFCESTHIRDKALVYIEHVLPLDIKHYTITQQSYRDNSDSANKSSLIQYITYSLNSSENALTVNCVFRNGIQIALELRVQSGSTKGDNSDTALIAATQSILKEQQIQTNSNSTEFLNLLDMVNLQNNQLNVSSGYTTFTLSHVKIPAGLKMVDGVLHVDSSKTIDVTEFRWERSVDLANPSAIPLFVVTFQDGVFYSLNDNRHLIEENQNAVNAYSSQSANSFPLTQIANADIPLVPITLVVVFAFVFISLLLYRRHRKTAK